MTNNQAPRKQSSCGGGIVKLFIITALISSAINSLFNPKSNDSNDATKSIKSEYEEEEELTIEEELLKNLDKEIVDKLINIITVDIGIPYDKLHYDEKSSKPDNNYYEIFTNDIILLKITADNDDVYRIWNNDFEFYNYDLENPVVTTLEQYNFKTFTREEQLTSSVILDNIMDDALRNVVKGKVEEEYYTKNGNFIQVVGKVSGRNAFNAKVYEDYVVQFYVLDWDNYTYEVSYIKIGDDSSGEYVEMQ